MGHVDGALIAQWLAARRRCCAANTVNLDIKALRAFYRFQRDWGDASAADLNRIPRQRRAAVRLPRWLSDEEVGRVLGALPLDTFIGLRDYAMVMTLYVTGARASELIGMELGDLVDDSVLYLRGKGAKARYVPLGDQLIGVLQGYLHARAALRPGKRVAFWLKANGRPLRNGRSVWEIVSKRIWQGLGRTGGVSGVGRSGRPWMGHYPHELRSSFATALLHRGCPLPAIAQLMGHSRLETTARYLGVDLALLEAAMACHPHARLRALSVQDGESGSAARPLRKVRKPSRDRSLLEATPTAPRRKR